MVFKDAAADASPFLQAFQPYLNGLNGSFLNMVRDMFGCFEAVLTLVTVEHEYRILNVVGHHPKCS
jgi:hypothetical protein